MQEIADKIWSNKKFHEAARLIERAWICSDLGLDVEMPNLESATKAMQAAAVLACSNTFKHRQAAFRVATCIYELHNNSTTSFGHALRVILTRLDNFPSISTRQNVEESLKNLPIALALEEVESAEKLQVNTRNGTLIFSPFQKKLWDTLLNQKSTAISAPTSAGKSFVLRKFVGKATSAIDKILYIVPTRALITQVSNDFYNEFSNLEENAPEIFTTSLEPGEEIPESVIFVMTQERAQLLLTNHPKFKPSMLIIDEAHAISDGGRGVLLQGVIDEVIRRNTKTQMLFASPMIENLDIFSNLFGLKNLSKIVSSEPSVLQNFLKIKIEESRIGNITIGIIDTNNDKDILVSRISLDGKLTTRAKILSRTAVKLGKNSANIIYANGADEAERVAINLATLLKERFNISQREHLAQLSIESVHESYQLAECLRKGVAFHYGEMPAQLRREIEHAVAEGVIDFLVCTSTLLQGVNLPAKNIFLLKPEKGSNQPLRSTDFWNLAGRAGRLLKEFQGNIFLIDYDSWKEKPLKHPKKEGVESALGKIVRSSYIELLREIRNRGNDFSKTKSTDIETSFMRLFIDSRKNLIDTTMTRIGEDPSSGKGLYLKNAIALTHDLVKLPDAILTQNLSISPYKQQELYCAIKKRIDSGDYRIKDLLPIHPQKSGAYASFVGILSECHKIILGLNPERKLARYHGVIALKWMKGEPLPKIIETQLQRAKTLKSRSVIRGVLEVIEKNLRFQAVRLINCYITILKHVLLEIGEKKLAEHIIPIPLFLEVGASEKTTISFISLGLSRSTAKKLGNKCTSKTLSTNDASDWLKRVHLSKLGLPDSALRELEGLHLRARIPDRS